MARDTIAFISTYEHPSRDSIESTLRTTFPEFRFEHIVLNDIVKAHLGWVLPNLAYVASEFGSKIIAKRITLREGYFRTTFLLRRIHATMRSIIDPGRHVFSFQTQSLYDTSVPGVPHYIYTDHTHLSNLESVYFDRRDLKHPGWIALERTLYQNTARVFTRSHNISADLVKHYGIAPEKIACVYAGANVEVPDNLELDNDGYGNQRILFIGTDWERKGGPVLAEAFRDVLRVLPRAHLTIIGASPVVDLPNCTVLGNVPLPELGAHFARSSVFCVPTRLEPFGIVFLEAMLHKLPVVATLVGALPDMVEDGTTGRLVPPGDAKALAAALIELLGNAGLCRRFGEAGHRLARQRYTWNAVGARMRDTILGTQD